MRLIAACVFVGWPTLLAHAQVPNSNPKPVSSITFRAFGYRITVPYFGQRLGQPDSMIASFGINGRPIALTVLSDPAALDHWLSSAETVEFSLRINDPRNIAAGLPAPFPYPLVTNSVSLSRKPQVRDIGNKKFNDEIEAVAAETDRAKFDEDGYARTPEGFLVLQGSKYRRATGSPLALRRVYPDQLNVTSLINPHLRVRYAFRPRDVPKDAWVDLDRFVVNILSYVIKASD